MTAPGRYEGVGTASLRTDDGRDVLYLRRRFLPAPGAITVGRAHVVQPGERPDLIAAVELGDAELWWQLADANGVMRADELTEPGTLIRIPMSGSAFGSGRD